MFLRPGLARGAAPCEPHSTPASSVCPPGVPKVVTQEAVSLWKGACGTEQSRRDGVPRASLDLGGCVRRGRDVVGWNICRQGCAKSDESAPHRLECSRAPRGGHLSRNSHRGDPTPIPRVRGRQSRSTAVRSMIAAERRSAQHSLGRTTPEAHLQPKAEVPGLTGPMVALIARPVLALAGQTGLALMMRARHRPDPFRRAAGYWMVTSSVADVGCLLALRASARREGLSFREAAGFGDHPVRNSGSAWVDVGALAPATVLSQFLDRLLNRGRADPYPAQIRASRTHGWTRAYSLTVWPVLWATTEEATYLGYALPRLERRLRNACLSGNRCHGLGGSARRHPHAPGQGLREVSRAHHASSCRRLYRGVPESRSTARAPGRRPLGIRFQCGGPCSCARIQP